MRPNQPLVQTQPVQYPHCDSRILHAPGECEFCDRHPEWQADRERQGIAFTGHFPVRGGRPCPGDEARPPGSQSDHRRWGGNKPTSADGDPSWPAETFASHVMYGDRGGRAPWPLPERIRRRVRQPFTNLRRRLNGWHRDKNGWWHYP